MDNQSAEGLVNNEDAVYTDGVTVTLTQTKGDTVTLTQSKGDTVTLIRSDNSEHYRGRKPK